MLYFNSSSTYYKEIAMTNSDTQTSNEIQNLIMSDIEAYKSTEEGKAAQKRLAKFIDKQMKKPRPRYLKKLRYGA
jgi:transposase-like protein